MRDYTHIGTAGQIAVIKAAILDQGAQAIYKAAVAAMEGRPSALAKMLGIAEPGLGDANRAMTVAYDHLSNGERAADYKSASAYLSKYLSKIGARGGSVKSEAKAAASKANGRKGGAPKLALQSTRHRDGTVTYWSVYNQVWVRADSIPDREYAAMEEPERVALLRHFGVKS